MYWVIEYLNGESISEKEKGFNEVDLNNVKRLYFVDKNDTYGVKGDGKFFINEIEYDFKIKKLPMRLIQFKKGLFNLNEGKEKIKSWNIGYEIYFNNRIEKYLLVVGEFGVSIEATIYDLNFNEIERRILKLK